MLQIIAARGTGGGHHNQPIYSGQSRDRTGDLAIFSRSLYQLSYLSVEPHRRSAERVRQPNSGR